MLPGNIIIGESCEMELTVLVIFLNKLFKAECLNCKPTTAAGVFIVSLFSLFSRKTAVLAVTRISVPLSAASNGTENKKLSSFFIFWSTAL